MPTLPAGNPADHMAGWRNTSSKLSQRRKRSPSTRLLMSSHTKPCPSAGATVLTATANSAR